MTKPKRNLLIFGFTSLALFVLVQSGTISLVAGIVVACGLGILACAICGER